MADNQKTKYKFGDNEIELRDYIHNLENNYSSYVNSRNWQDWQRQEFRNSYEKYLQGLKDQLQNNTNRFRTDSAGSIYDSTGELNNNDNDENDPAGFANYYDNKGNRITSLDYKLLDKKKQKKYYTFQANREVATYMQKVGQAVQKQLSEKPKSNNAFELSKHGFEADWRRMANPSGGNLDFTPYAEGEEVDSEGKRGTSKRAAYLKEQLDNYIANLQDYDFSNSSFKDRDSYLAKLRAASENLANGYNHEDTIALTQAGLSSDFLDNFFSTGKQESPQKTELEKAAEQAALEIKQREEDAKNREIIELNERKKKELEMSNYFNSFIQENPFQRTIDNTILPTYDYDKAVKSIIEKYPNINLEDAEQRRQVMNSHVNFPQLVSYIRGKSKAIGKGKEEGKDMTLQHIARNLDLAYQEGLFNDPRYLIEGQDKKSTSILGDSGFVVIPDSENYSNYSFIGYNPVTRQYKEFSMINNSDLSETINRNLRERMAYDAYNKNNVQKNEKGGILKLQIGGQGALRHISEYKKARELREAKDARIEEKVKSTGRTREQVEAGERKISDGLKGEDYTRIASVALDALSAASAYVPVYGTAASAGLGIASTLTNLGADMADDSVSGWDALKNAGFGLGMDLVGLIPGYGSAGKAAKIARILKPVAKTAAALMAANGLMDSSKAVGKLLSNPSDLNADDWRNLVTGLQVISGGVRYRGGVKAKNKSLENLTTKTPYTSIETKSGNKVKLTPEQFNELKSTKGLDKQNEILSKIAPGEELGKEFKTGKFDRLRHVHRNPKTKSGIDVSMDKDWTKEEFLPRGYTVKNGQVVPKFLSNDWIAARGVIGNDKWLERIQDKLFGRQKNPLYVTPNPKPSKRDLIDQAIQKQFDTNPNFVFRKEGGILNRVRKFQLGGVEQVAGDWYTTIYSKIRDNIAQGLKDNKYTYGDINEMGTRHSQIYGRWKSGNQKTLVNDNATKQYQQDIIDHFGTVNADGITNGWNTGRYKTGKNPYTGDNPNKQFTVDSAFSGITDDRRILGREGDFTPEQLAKEQEYWKSQGYNMKLNDETKYYILDPLKDPANVEAGEEVVNEQGAKEGVTNTRTNTETLGNNGSPKNTILSRLINNPTLTYGLPRAVAADRFNRRITDLAKASTVPLLKDPLEVHRYTRSDLDAEMQGEKNYADLRRLASKPLTSDGNLQSAMQLQAEVQGQQARTAGKEKSNQVQRQYDELAWQQEKENAANRHETAMFNRAQLWNTDKTKSAFEQAYLSKKHNIWDVFGQQLEFDARTKLNETKALRDRFAQSDIHNAVSNSPNEFGANLTPEELTAWNKVLTGTKPSSLGTEFDAYVRAMKKVSDTEQQQLGSYYNIPRTIWSNKAKLANVDQWEAKAEKAPVASKKSGGNIAIAGIKAKTADAERFQKQIKECIDRNEKAIERLSKSLYGIIQSSLIK